MSRITAGRLIFTFLAVFLIVSPYLADWNVTHIYNPQWPPHAKFHNGQTMALGTLLGLAALFFTWRSSADRVGNVLAAAVLNGVYWWTQVAARFYPGAAWTDPEFLKPGQTMGDLGPQAYLDMVTTVLVLLACWLMWPRRTEGVST